MISIAIAVVVSPIRLYIDPNGNDSRDAHSRSSSIQSFQKLKQILQSEHSKDPNREILVEVNGTIHVGQTIEFGPEFSNVEMFGSPKGSISGGVLLGKPKPDRFNNVSCQSVTVPDGIVPKQLFANQTRLNRPTLPKTGFYQFTAYPDGAEKVEWNKGQTSMKFKPDDLKNWRNLDQVEIVAHHLWVTSILPIKSVDEATNTVQFTKQSVFKLSDDYTGGAAPYTVENVAEAFGGMNEWYFDPPTHKIYFTSEPKLKNAELVAPTVSTLVRVTNAKNFQIRNLNFRHTEWSYPAGMAGDGQAAISVPGVIQIQGCTHGIVSACHLQNIGTYGIEILSGSNGTNIHNCVITDAGAGGVKIGHDTSGTKVEMCSIDGGGRIYAPAIGIWIGNSGDNIVRHNDIHDLFYTGISVGWTWGYGPSKAINNKIEYNHIWKIGQTQLSDMGGIYTLGVSPGTTIRYNRIDDIQARGYGGWGIYTDEGSSGILVEDNVVTNTKTGGFHQHYGKENIVRNNVFAYAAKDGQIIRSRQEDHTSFTFEHNVVLWKGTELLGGNWSNGHFVFGHNLLSREDGKVNLPIGDQGSVIVPSLILDRKLMPPKDLGDQIGFIPFDINQAGRHQNRVD